ncbi:MAG: hypothetical protein C0399_06345 [Syntrophus sp. (in: bacteria)]|nr:hypothetical protein [Syntrophus sp. (in: bacteria)]
MKKMNLLQRFLKDPNNLRYSLNIIVPLIVFLTCLLSIAVGSNILAPMKTKMVWVWIFAASLFSSLCAFIIMRTMTHPINDLVRKAQQYVKFEALKKERGQMIEVYRLIEGLMEYIHSKTDAGEQNTLTEGLENLDYIIPLGYMSLMVAHEVRNPLNTITGMSELLKQKITDESQIVYIETLLEAANKINIFTRELLDFNDNELAKERFDVHDIIDEVIRNLMQVQKKNIICEFNKEGELICFADRTKIYQIIANIVKNAIDHEKDGGYIRIDTGMKNDLISVSIYNKSSKIEEKDYGSIFKPFFTLKKGGKGLGLFIAMRNMKLHGGDITITSGDEGTTFTIKLPLKDDNGNGAIAVEQGET